MGRNKQSPRQLHRPRPPGSEFPGFGGGGTAFGTRSFQLRSLDLRSRTINRPSINQRDPTLALRNPSLDMLPLTPSRSVRDAPEHRAPPGKVYTSYQERIRTPGQLFKPDLPRYQELQLPPRY